MANERKRLKGRDGEVYAITKDTPLEGTEEGTALTAGTYYIVSKVAATGSGLPEGIVPGYVIKGAAAITVKTGDEVVPLSLTKKCDIQSFSVEYSADEIDVTTLCDDQRTYLAGFTEATGSLEGVTTLNVSEYLMNKFIPIVEQTGDTIEVSEIDGENLILRLVLNKKGSEIMSYFTPATITSFNIGAGVDDAQTYTANFRNTPDDDLIPCILKEIETAGA